MYLVGMCKTIGGGGGTAVANGGRVVQKEKKGCKDCNDSGFLSTPQGFKLCTREVQGCGGWWRHSVENRERVIVIG